MKLIVRAQSRLYQLVPWVVLAFLLTYAYVIFFVAPYPGFDFLPQIGEVNNVFVTSEPIAGLQTGDKLLRVGPVSWQEYETDLRQTLFDGVEPGQVVPILIERGGQEILIQWEYPGPILAEVLDRIFEPWWIAFAFWSLGTLTFLFIRPKDSLWRLLVALCYLTAIWIIAGFASPWGIWHSAIFYSVAVWFCSAVYLHLHWVFPQPLAQLPKWVWRLFYLAVVVLAISEWFQLLPPKALWVGVFLAFTGSMGLLIAHARSSSAQRSDLGLLFTFLGFDILPMLATALAGQISQNENIISLALLGAPAIPLAYLYTAYRHRFGIWEWRANKGISMFIFATLLITVSSLTIIPLRLWLNLPNETIFASVLSVLLAGLGSVIFYTDFQRRIERFLLRVPQPPSDLIEIYSDRITTTQNIEGLTSLLNDEILPSLLIRQSALLRLDEGQRSNIVYANGISGELLPFVDDPVLLAQPGQYRPVAGAEEHRQAWPWVRLALPLRLGNRLSGMWLFGRRDPDDYYAHSEIEVLQSLANQTAVALNNILQAEHLQSLYRANVGREEAERSRLALELHDDVLGQMALLAMSADEQSQNAAFRQAYQAATEHVREVINTLRPAMLNYGLRVALEELVDNMLDLAGDAVQIQVDVDQSTERYPLEVEGYVYRIVQQACQNAIQHAHPNLIRISGQLAASKIDLTVEDDGVGFVTGGLLDLVSLLAEKHFGLAGMYERAAVIGAQLLVDSTPHTGTKVQVVWNN